MSSLLIGSASVADAGVLRSVFDKLDPIILVEKQTDNSDAHSRLLVRKVGKIPPTKNSKYMDIVILGPGFYHPHIHDHTSLTLVVVVGKGIAYVGKDEVNYSKGDTIYIPSGVDHGFIVLDSTMMISFLDEPIIGSDGAIHDYRSAASSDDSKR